MLETLAHLFTPRYSNNQRPRLLHPIGLAILVAIVLVFHSSLELIKASPPRGFVLGYASNITTSQVLDGINTERAKLGILPLTLDQQLSAAAANKAQHMFELDYWAHIAPDGTTPWNFIKQQEYSYSIAGENLARDFDTTPTMIEAWMDSPTHRDNIVHSRYSQTGIAVVNGQLDGLKTTLVVQMFGSPSSAALPTTQTKPSPAITQTAQTTSTLSLPNQSSVLSDTQTNRGPISPLRLKQSIALSIIFLVIGVIALDELLFRKSQTIRFVGKNLAHLSFLTAVIIIVLALKPGGVI